MKKCKFSYHSNPIIVEADSNVESGRGANVNSNAESNVPESNAESNIPESNVPESNAESNVPE